MNDSPAADFNSFGQASVPAFERRLAVTPRAEAAPAEATPKTSGRSSAAAKEAADAFTGPQVNCQVKLPQDLAGLGIGGLQEARGRAPEDEVAAGGQHAAPQRRVVRRFPDDLAGLRIDRAQRADVVVVDRLDREAGGRQGRSRGRASR